MEIKRWKPSLRESLICSLNSSTFKERTKGRNVVNQARCLVSPIITDLPMNFHVEEKKNIRKKMQRFLIIQYQDNLSTVKIRRAYTPYNCTPSLRHQPSFTCIHVEQTDSPITEIKRVIRTLLSVYLRKKRKDIEREYDIEDIRRVLRYLHLFPSILFHEEKSKRKRDTICIKLSQVKHFWLGKCLKPTGIILVTPMILVTLCI